MYKEYNTVVSMMFIIMMLWNKNWINEEKNSTDVNKVTFH